MELSPVHKFLLAKCFAALWKRSIKIPIWSIEYCIFDSVALAAQCFRAAGVPAGGGFSLCQCPIHWHTIYEETMRFVPSNLDSAFFLIYLSETLDIALFSSYIVVALMGTLFGQRWNRKDERWGWCSTFIDNRERGFLGEINEKFMEKCISSWKTNAFARNKHLLLKDNWRFCLKNAIVHEAPATADVFANGTYSWRKAWNRVAQASACLLLFLNYTGGLVTRTVSLYIGAEEGMESLRKNFGSHSGGTFGCFFGTSHWRNCV